MHHGNAFADTLTIHPLKTSIIIISAAAIIEALIAGLYLGSRNGKSDRKQLDELRQHITELTADRDVQRANAAAALRQKDAQQVEYENRIAELKTAHQSEQTRAKNASDRQLEDLKTTNREQMGAQKTDYENRITELKTSHARELAQAKEAFEQQLEAIKTMNREQMDAQLGLIREQMQTTSEKILKERQAELGEHNREQVSKLLDPLQQSFRAMQEAFDKSKQQQNDALLRLDQTIRVNMEQSTALGQTADRLTRALTGEVKVQGNFGELKLRQLLEDLGLKEGEQFDSQETLRDRAGRAARADDGKGLIPDFILHFPNNRHVVVDSKMSLTDYERYMNTEDNVPEKAEHLRAHIASVRAQVRRLARKEYTRYLPDGYNRLNFAIMYVPIEGALNLALFNDATLWREAYDMGVLILGPQTMYMNLRVLEMMWTQVRQLSNQQAMMDAANKVIERVQDFGMRLADVETSLQTTVSKLNSLKVTTADSGRSIITAARALLKAGATESKKKRSLASLDPAASASDTPESTATFLDSDTTTLLSPTPPAD